MTRNKYGFSTDYAERKNQPIVTGFLDYFPLAVLAVAEVSNDGNAQHNPGQPLHWAREKSQDEVNTEARHLLERGDKDGAVLHSAKRAWRAMADLQKEIEKSLCTDPDCEVHVHNKDMGGACPLLPRAATWYGRTRDAVKPAIDRHARLVSMINEIAERPIVCDKCSDQQDCEPSDFTPTQPEHVCGLQGFGALGDVCGGCAARTVVPDCCNYHRAGGVTWQPCGRDVPKENLRIEGAGPGDPLR